MPSPRVAPLEPPYPAEMQADFDKLMRGAPPLKLFRTLAHNPRVLSRMMAGGLLDRGPITLRQRELMILRTTARCGAEYEWGVHVAAFGNKAAWTPEQVAASANGPVDAAIWSTDERLILALADQLHESQQVDATLWQALSAAFATDQLVELVMLAGLYHAVSFCVNAFEVQNEDFAPSFPPAA